MKRVDLSQDPRKVDEIFEKVAAPDKEKLMFSNYVFFMRKDK